jgi:hypothetical protein
MSRTLHERFLLGDLYAAERASNQARSGSYLDGQKLTMMGREVDVPLIPVESKARTEERLVN